MVVEAEEAVVWVGGLAVVGEAMVWESVVGKPVPGALRRYWER